MCEQAERIGWVHETLDEARRVYEVLIHAAGRAHEAWQTLDKNEMLKALEEAQSVGLESDDVQLLAFITEGREKDYLQKCFKLNTFLGRTDVVTDITMTMKVFCYPP